MTVLRIEDEQGRPMGMIRCDEPIKAHKVKASHLYFTYSVINSEDFIGKQVITSTDFIVQPKNT